MKLEVKSMLKPIAKAFSAGLLVLALAAPLQADPLKPLRGIDPPQLKDVVRVEMETDLGPLQIDVYPQAAPNAAKRFLELVEMGFYDDTPIFRVVKSPKPFVAQFGINSKYKEWKDKNFKDDPSLFQLSRGTLAFAKAGIDSNSTQVFISYGDNSFLAVPEHNFSAFAQVVSGMELADQFASVGDPGMGLDQTTLWMDTHSIDGMRNGPTMIKSARIVKPEDANDASTPAP